MYNSTSYMLNEIKQATRQRLKFIEVMAYYTGIVKRSDVAMTFAMSDAAATKDLKFYCDIAPGNIVYKHNVFGFVPTDQFKPVFSDLSPTAVLPLLETNLIAIDSPSLDKSVFGIATEGMRLPSRLPSEEVFCQITRAIYAGKKLKVLYYSLSEGENVERIIEPHALVNTGFRWHVRAYNENSFDFRDFVLSRFAEADCLAIQAESDVNYDEDWTEFISLQLSPHPKLTPEQKTGLLIDYKAKNQVVEISIRRALIGYLLQQLGVDTTVDHSLNPKKYQLIILNRDEIEPFASWAFT